MFDFLAMAIYVVMWWLVFTLLIPIGCKPPSSPQKGHAASAPEKPRIRLKLVLATILSAPISWLLWKLLIQ